jgi:methyltransferase
VNVIAFGLAVVFGMMLAELNLSRRHERWLLGQGAVVPDGDVYWAIALLYPTAFLVMGLEGLWRVAAEAGSDAGTRDPSWAASGLVLFAASKLLKYWAVRALGPRWTFRVMVVPGWRPVTTGPYRYVAHPNYVAVVGELVGAAMMFGAIVTGPVAIVAFGLALAARIRFETGVLRKYSSQHTPEFER